MLVVQMNCNGPMTNGLAELNHDIQDGEGKETRFRIMGDGQELSEEDESQINEDGDDNRRVEVVQGNNHVQPIRPHRQHRQGPVVRWERFLPLRSLKVLLVENDDSTRHVVTALLKNCGYEVTAVANGLQAWKLLEDLMNHIDLVLTEVVMPCLSGIGLLSKIVNHKTCKNIPVIVMSSHDSMSIVFKCLSKGAVDFLVKPIRKNELKNLWQHVWRKCHSSTGSGSESGIRTLKSTKSKSAEESDNNTSSNDEEEDVGSIGLNARDGSDHGSGTQSSWTKRAIEVDSPKPMSLWDQVADPPDSTCAQVIHSRPEEALDNNWVPVTMENMYESHDDGLGKDLDIGVPRIPNLQIERENAKAAAKIGDNNREKLPEITPKKDDWKAEKAQAELKNEKPDGESRNQPIDAKGVNTNSADPSIVFDISNGLCKVNREKEKVAHETKETPCLELSLKRHRDVADTGTSAHERNVLRHSDLSAFSRYNSASTANQAPTGNVASCSPFNNCSEAVKTDSMHNLQSNSNSTPPNQRSNGSSNNNDMGSTTNNAFTKPVLFSDKPAPKSVKGSNPSSAFQTAQNGVKLDPHPGKSDVAIANNNLFQARDTNQQVQVEHHHHHYHLHHHCVHNMQQQQQHAKDDSLSHKNMAAAAPQCGSSNMLSTPADNAFGRYSLNGSGSGSDHGSNGLNGSSIARNLKGANAERDNRASVKAETACGNVIRAIFDQNRSAQREAALNKFRHKRKERCFEKKVRYQSRKKLAEQRPRVRGQFVRQATVGNREKDAENKQKDKENEAHS